MAKELRVFSRIFEKIRDTLRLDYRAKPINPIEKYRVFSKKPLKNTDFYGVPWNRIKNSSVNQALKKNLIEKDTTIKII